MEVIRQKRIVLCNRKTRTFHLWTFFSVPFRFFPPSMLPCLYNSWMISRFSTEFWRLNFDTKINFNRSQTICILLYKYCKILLTFLTCKTDWTVWKLIVYSNTSVSKYLFWLNSTYLNSFAKPTHKRYFYSLEIFDLCEYKKFRNIRKIHSTESEC